jgi:LPXTG-site transpeptidase (sortase) family protein
MRALTLKRAWTGFLGVLLVGGVASLVVGVVMLLRAGPSEVEVSGAGGSLSDGSSSSADGPSGAGSYGQISSQRPSAKFRLMIDSVGINAPIETFTLDEEGLPEVPAAGHVVAWYDFSAWPGRGSNAVFAGHLNWDRSPAVFENLKWVDVGDEIRLQLRDINLSYIVTERTNVKTDDPASLKVMEPTAKDTITLITCGGTWVLDPSEAYGGTYSDRVVIRAELAGESAPGGLPSGFGF